MQVASSCRIGSAFSCLFLLEISGEEAAKSLDQLAGVERLELCCQYPKTLKTQNFPTQPAAQCTPVLCIGTSKLSPDRNTFLNTDAKAALASSLGICDNACITFRGTDDAIGIAGWAK
jgi:hypothetical protein